MRKYFLQVVALLYRMGYLSVFFFFVSAMPDQLPRTGLTVMAPESISFHVNGACDENVRFGVYM